MPYKSCLGISWSLSYELFCVFRYELSAAITKLRPPALLCGFLRIDFEQSTRPNSQHSTCLVSQQQKCLGSEQGAFFACQQ